MSIADPRVRHPLASVGLRATDARIGMAIFVIPLAIDWVTGGILVIASLLAGFALNSAVVWFREAREVAAWERAHGMRLLTEAAHNVIPRRRYFLQERAGEVTADSEIDD